MHCGTGRAVLYPPPAEWGHWLGSRVGAAILVAASRSRRATPARSYSSYPSFSSYPSYCPFQDRASPLPLL
jgi:hypothetical protein